MRASAKSGGSLRGDAASPTRQVRRRPLSRQALFFGLAVWSVFTLLPLLWSVVASFTPAAEIFGHLVPFSWRTFLPEHVTLGAYRELFSNPTFVRALFNTLLVCGATVLGGLAVNSLAGFAFAVFDFPFKRVFMALVFVSFMVPFEAVVLPLFGLAQLVGLTNSYQALILPALANGGVVYLFRQFFSETPRELLESARMDGLSWWGIYLRIVLPLSAPVLISAGLTLFLVQWEAFFWPLLVINRPEYQMVQQALANFNTQYGTRWDIQLAGAVISMIVPMILIAALQRYYIATVAGSGSKE